MIKIIEKRNQRIFPYLQEPVGNLFGDTKSYYTKSCLDLLDHSFFPLAVSFKKLEPISTQTLDYERGRFSTLNNYSELRHYVVSLTDQIEGIMSNLVPKQPKSSEPGENQKMDALSSKIAKQVTHCIQHFGQVIFITGLIEQNFL